MKFLNAVMIFLATFFFLWCWSSLTHSYCSAVRLLVYSDEPSRGLLLVLFSWRVYWMDCFSFEFDSSSCFSSSWSLSPILFSFIFEISIWIFFWVDNSESVLGKLSYGIIMLVDGISEKPKKGYWRIDWLVVELGTAISCTYKGLDDCWELWLNWIS